MGASVGGPRRLKSSQECLRAAHGAINSFPRSPKSGPGSTITRPIAVMLGLGFILRRRLWVQWASLDLFWIALGRSWFGFFGSLVGFRLLVACFLVAVRLFFGSFPVAFRFFLVFPRFSGFHVIFLDFPRLFLVFLCFS